MREYAGITPLPQVSVYATLLVGMPARGGCVYAPLEMA